LSTGRTSNEAWGSRLGLILAMAGNAIGLGNFLRFPVQAASNGGGSFMITYFTALLLLGIPLMWIEWGIGRNGGRYRKGHIPGMFAAIWKHPAAKYIGVIGMVIPLVVMIYYTYIESWTLAFTWFSLTGDYWGRGTQQEMVNYLQSFQGVGASENQVHSWWTPYAFFLVTLGINVWVISKGISGGVEKLARIGMPFLFLFAVILAGVVMFLPAGPDGSTPWTGLNFIYNPDLSRLDEPSVWLASAGQIFFTLSVGMGSLQAYASYLTTKDDIALNGIATAATNETAEVVLGGSIAIPAAVVFFGLLFFAGITSSVAMLTPIVAFFREEFGFRREPVCYALGALTLVCGLMHITWLEHGVLDEWDYWAGTFGLVVLAVIETIIFIWVFKPENAWRSIHQGADIQIPRIFKFVMTYVTPVYLLVILTWWGWTDALPILKGDRIAPGSETYVMISRGVILLFAVAFIVLIKVAWTRNKYNDYEGLREVDRGAASAQELK
jgi:SNF family Na+-dependent transporter